MLIKKELTYRRINFLQMNKLSKAFLIILILFASACEKDPTPNNSFDTVIFGTVLDAESNQPIEGVSILCVNVYDLIRPDTSFVTQTDNNGKYQLKQKVSLSEYGGSAGTYFIAHYKNYFNSNLNYIIGNINECNIKLVKNSFLKVHIKNATPYNSSDLYRFGVDSNNDYSNYWYNFNGMYIDTSLTLNIIPNTTHLIRWSSKKNNILTSTNENVYFQSGDTIYRSILY